MKKFKASTFFVSDVFLVAIGFFLSRMFILSMNELVVQFALANHDLILSFCVILFTYGLCFLCFGVYKDSWLNTGFSTYLSFILISIFCFFIVGIISMIFAESAIFKNAPIAEFKMNLLAVLISSGLMFFSRIVIRWIYDVGRRNEQQNKNYKKLLIVGAGQAGKMLVSDIRVNEKLKYRIMGFIDDDESLVGMLVYEGYRVVGNRYDITNICAKLEIDDIIIAVPSANDADLKDILRRCSNTDCDVKILPSIDKMLDKDKGFYQQIRKVEIEDLLEREPIILDTEKISDEINDKIVLVSGGGGSIGSELCRQIATFKPKRLIILDIYENNAYDLQNELIRKYPNLDLCVLIASVRDYNRISAIFSEYKPSIIFHAAAHKHVPLMEDSPCEAVKNNIFGTYNIAKCASENGCAKFVMISTDKAVNPTNVMGATKRMCEMIVQSFQTVSKTEFVAVRFGNVLGSNGSVIPLFKKQIEEGGPLTVTHKEITRFFMTIPEAAQLVLQASSYAKGGEIFVLDMGKPVKIYDLAVNLIKLSGYKPNVDIKIKVTGLRPGEKLYEELLMNEEGLGKTLHSKIFIGKPTFSNINEIEMDLKKLGVALKTDNNDIVVKTLKEVVPTFVSADEFNKKAM